MTTIATDGKSMAGDGQVCDHFDTIVEMARRKVHALTDGRVVGCSGNSLDAAAYVDWLKSGKDGPCPIEDDRFAALILHPSGDVYWVDHKGREAQTPPPCAIGSGQDYAYGAMAAGASPTEAVEIAATRDRSTGGTIITERPSILREVA